jgi:hypothetical protein
MAIAGLKGSFLLISFLNLDPVISIKEIKFAENLDIIKLVKKLTNQRNRIAILYCDGIETLVINTKLQGTILFGHKDHWHTCRAYGFPNVTLL